MIQISCPSCNQTMDFSDKRGEFHCNICNTTIPVTELELPQLGNYRNSLYIPDMANDNICETYDYTDTPNTPTQYDECYLDGVLSYYIDNHCKEPLLTEDEIINSNKNYKVLPIKISNEEACHIFDNWSAKGLFTPSKYRRHFNNSGLTKLYIPAIIYNINVQGYIEATCTTSVEQKSSKSHTLTTHYHNVNREIESKYKPFAIYENDTTTIDSIISSTETKLNNLLRDYSSTYVEQLDTDIIIKTEEHVLIPVWMYCDNKTNHIFYINALTGTTYGTPPVSKPKIISSIAVLGTIISTFSSIILHFLGLLTLLLCFIFIPQTAEASERYSFSFIGNTPVIDDSADILTDYEEVIIINEASKYQKKTEYQYIFATANTGHISNKEDELEHIYNLCRSEISSDGTVLFLITFDGSSYDCELQCYTLAKEYYTHEICDDIENKLNNIVNSEKLTTVISSLLKYLDMVDEGSYVIDSETKQRTISIPVLLLIIVVSFTLATALVTVMLPKGHTDTRSDFEYYISPEVKLLKKQNTYIRSYINHLKH